MAKCPAATPERQRAYLAIARNLREFGYDGVSANMIRDVDEAIQAGRPLPHDIVGMFAKRQLEEAGLTVESDTE
jgi:hypothetical protein